VTRLQPVQADAPGRRDWLLEIGAGEIRRACGVSQGTAAAALGVSQKLVSAWETGLRAPVGEAGAAYCRVIAGLARHLEVPEDPWEESAESLLAKLVAAVAEACCDPRTLRQAAARRAAPQVNGCRRAYGDAHRAAHLISTGQRAALCGAEPREGREWLGADPRHAVRLASLPTCPRCSAQARLAADLAAAGSRHVRPGAVAVECTGCGRLRIPARLALCASCVRARTRKRAILRAAGKRAVPAEAPAFAEGREARRELREAS
jgi:transcriptional regulator with XRE-family HTH domain